MDLIWNILAFPDAYSSMSVLDLQAGGDFAADWAAWHKKHEDRLNAPDGFLAITSINWLTETPARFPDAPGEWSASDAGVAGRPLPRRVGEPGRGLREPVDAGDREEAVRRVEPVLVLLVPRCPVGGEVPACLEVKNAHTAVSVREGQNIPD